MSTCIRNTRDPALPSWIQRRGNGFPICEQDLLGWMDEVKYMWPRLIELRIPTHVEQETKSQQSLEYDLSMSRGDG